MEDLKSQMRMPINLDLHMFVSKKMKQNNAGKNDALEVGSYVAANFMRAIFKDKGNVSREEIAAIFGNIIDFYTSNFKGQFSQSDFDSLTTTSLQVLQMPDSEKISKDYFNNLMSS